MRSDFSYQFKHDAKGRGESLERIDMRTATWLFFFSLSDLLRSTGGPRFSAETEDAVQLKPESLPQPRDESLRVRLCRVPRNVINVNKGFVVQSETTSAEECLLSVKETAKRLGICRRTLEREVISKKLPPPAKVRGKSVYFLSDVTRYLSNLKAARDGVASSS